MASDHLSSHLQGRGVTSKALHSSAARTVSPVKARDRLSARPRARVPISDGCVDYDRQSQYFASSEGAQGLPRVQVRDMPPPKRAAGGGQAMGIAEPALNTPCQAQTKTAALKPRHATALPAAPIGASAVPRAASEGVTVARPPHWDVHQCDREEGFVYNLVSISQGQCSDDDTDRDPSIIGMPPLKTRSQSSEESSKGKSKLLPARRLSPEPGFDATGVTLHSLEQLHYTMPRLSRARAAY